MTSFRPAFLARLSILSALLFCNGKIAQAQSEMPSQSYLDQFQVVRHWWGTASIDASRDRVKLLTLGEKYLYLQSELGAIAAFDPETGERRWCTQIGSGEEANSKLVESGDLLLVCSGMTLYGVQRDDGNVRWKASLRFAASANPAGFQDKLYIPTSSGVLYAIDIKKLNELHATGKISTESDRAILWSYITSNPINMAPIATQSYVCFAGADGTVYSVSANRRELRFRFEARTQLACPLVMAKESFLVTAENFHIYNINQATGQVRWEFVSGPRITQAPVLIDQQVFLVPEQGGMFCLDLTKGEKYWDTVSAAKFIAASDKHVYASDRLNRLLVLSRESGEVSHRLGLEQFTVRAGNDRNDRVYMSTPDGLVIALRDHDQVTPILHPLQLPEPDKEEGTGTAPAKKGKTATTPAESSDKSEDSPQAEPEEAGQSEAKK